MIEILDIKFTIKSSFKVILTLNIFKNILYIIAEISISTRKITILIIDEKKQVQTTKNHLYPLIFQQYPHFPLMYILQKQ